MSALHVNSASFASEVEQSAVPVLVDFWAPWCGPCQMMGPVVDAMASTYGSDKIKIVKINVDEEGELAGKFNVMSIPTFAMFKGGQVVDTMVGGMSEEKLKAFIDKHSV